MSTLSRRTPRLHKPRGPKALSGIIMPYGWHLLRHDTFGTAGSVPDFATLHKLYFEGQYYNRDYQGLIVSNPINGQQQVYQHFENAIVFSTDHLTIQGRGTGTTTATSGQMSSRWHDRSFVFEAKFKTPNTAGTWLEAWAYPFEAGDSSELDVEIVQSGTGGPESVNEVFFANHGDTATNIAIPNPASFNTDYMRYVGPGYDASSIPHTYTIYYDDATGIIRRYLDGMLMYAANWKWMQSLGGTGFGTDANFTIDLAIGGSWPGNIADLTGWTGDLDIYSISYYTKRAIPTGQAWNQGHKNGFITLSGNSMTAAKSGSDGVDAAAYSTITVSSGKWYWEVVLQGSSHLGAGIGTSLGSIYPGRYLGNDPNTIGQYGNGAYNNQTGIASAGSFDPSVAGGARLCFALDMDNKKLWSRITPTGNWLNDIIANQNPAGNVGGIALPAALQADVGPACSLYTSSSPTPDTALGCFQADAITGTPPAGFSTFA